MELLKSLVVQAAGNSPLSSAAVVSVVVVTGAVVAGGGHHGSTKAVACQPHRICIFPAAACRLQFLLKRDS